MARGRQQSGVSAAFRGIALLVGLAIGVAIVAAVIATTLSFVMV